MCSCIAASAVTGLNVEPRGYAAAIARFSGGWFIDSAARDVSPGASGAFSRTRPTYSDGGYVGFDASARTEPSRGSSATIAPPFEYQHPWQPELRARSMP